MGPPEQFDRSKAPKEFWLDSTVEGTPQERSDSAKAFEDFRKRDGLGSFIGKRPTTPPVFPARTSEGGYGNRKSGYDDSRKTSHQTHTKKNMAFTEPVDLE